MVAWEAITMSRVSTSRRRTLRRRLLGLLPRVGLTVHDLLPGTVVLTRRRRLHVQGLDPDTALVARRGRRHVLRVDDDTLLVGRRGGLRVTEVGGAVSVVSPVKVAVRELLPDGTVALDVSGKHEIVPLTEGAALVREPKVTRNQWQDTEKAVHGYLVPEHVAGLLRLYRVNCVLDVGANRGQYAQELRRAGYRGHIVSFEPVPAVFEQLARAAANDEKWTVHQVALAATDGTTSMHVVPGTLSSLLAPTEFGATRYAKLRDTTEVEVPMRRLDGFLDEATGHVPDRRLYLKLDTQGYDLQVFTGLGERVREIVGMQSEVALMKIYEGMPRLPEALGVYEAAGFEVTGLYPVSRERRTARVLEFDCIMVRAEAR